MYVTQDLPIWTREIELGLSTKYRRAHLESESILGSVHLIMRTHNFLLDNLTRGSISASP